MAVVIESVQPFSLVSAHVRRESGAILTHSLINTYELKIFVQFFSSLEKVKSA